MKLAEGYIASPVHPDGGLDRGGLPCRRSPITHGRTQGCWSRNEVGVDLLGQVGTHGPVCPGVRVAQVETYSVTETGQHECTVAVRLLDKIDATRCWLRVSGGDYERR
jgi:hypothetical protein